MSSGVQAQRRVHFERPPLSEVTVGCQFVPVERLRLVEILGWRRESLGETYPNTEEAARLAPNFEFFGGRQPSVSPFRLLKGPEIPRLWFITESGSELVQMQNDRMHFNWRKRKGNEQYPHGEYMLDKFVGLMTSLDSWLRDHKIGRLEVNQCEISYINHIELGTSLLPAISDLGKVFNCLQLYDFPDAQAVNFAFQRDLAFGGESLNARLHLSIQPAVLQESGNMIVQYESTVRGRSQSPEFDSVRRFLEGARDETRAFFLKVTTPDAQEFWGRQS